MPTTTVFPIGFGQIQYIWTLTGDPEPITCGLDFEVETPPFTQANAQAIADAMGTSWGSLGLTAYTFQRVEILIKADAGDPLEFQANDITPGGSVLAPLPQNSTYLFRKITGVSGRRNRGRMYIPGVPETQVDPTGFLLGAEVTRIDQMAAALQILPSLGPANISRLVILHSYQWVGTVDPGPPAGFPAPTTIVGISPDPRIATQRRRMR